jgi:spoIIIJ-associated protein
MKAVMSPEGVEARADLRGSGDAVFSAATVDAAILAGLQSLDLVPEEATIEVLDRGSRGFLGFRSRAARVKVAPKLGLAGLIEELAREVLSRMGLKASVEGMQKGPDVVLRVESEEAGLLIGRKGETLEALQHLLLRMASRKTAGKIRDLRVDVGGYRSRREDQLREEALALAERVERSGRRAMTEPLPPAERRVVHRALADRAGVTTHVAGDGNARRVIILPASSSKNA